MVQVPTATNVTLVPDKVQMLNVVEVKLTGKFDVAVAVRVGDVPNAAFGSAPKVMTWLPGVTEKLWLTDGATAQLVVAATVAWIVQVPTKANVTVVPDTPQIVGVCEVKLTGRPDVDVALTVSKPALSAVFGGGPKVIVWLPCVT